MSPTETVLAVLSIVVTLLTIVSIVSGAVGTVWRKARGKRTPIEELRDELALIRSTSEEALGLRQAAAEAPKIAGVGVVKFKSRADQTPGRTDPSGLQLHNSGPAMARNVWAEIQNTPTSPVQRSDTIEQLSVGHTSGFLGRGPSGDAPPGQQFEPHEILARYGWEDGRGPQTTEWRAYRRE